MNSFSIRAYKCNPEIIEDQPIVSFYKQWLENDLYESPVLVENLEDPIFLQKLSLLQADGIRRDIGTHAAITHNSILSAGNEIGLKIQSVADLLSNSIDKGFFMMNSSLLDVNNNLGSINHSIDAMHTSLLQNNQILSDISKDINRGFYQMNCGIKAMGMEISRINLNMIAGFNSICANISQSVSLLQYQTQQSIDVLKSILDELQIPESQRERRYHIEEGIKYFNKGIKSGDCLYFEDALEEFTTSIEIEKKDFFSWYYIGMIYLYSKDHLDIEKALSAFDRYIHYAEALPYRHTLFNEALMMKAECFYLGNNTGQAYQTIREIVPTSVKAAFRAMKYLSASNIDENKHEAKEILQELMRNNPYCVMQILEDYDLVNNNYIIQFLQDYNKDLQEFIINQMSLCDSVLNEFEPWPNIHSEFKTILDRIRAAKSSVPGILDFIKMREDFSIYVDALKAFKDDTEELSMFEEDGKYGFRGIHGHVFVPCQWEEVRYFHEGLAAVKDSNDKWGFIDKTGRIIIPCQFDWVGDFHEGLAHVSEGFIDKNGQIVLSTKYPKDFYLSGDFHEGLASVGLFSSTGYKGGYINKEGQLVIRGQWENFYKSDFHEGLAAVMDHNKKFGFINSTGKVVISCQWDNVSYEGFKDGIVGVQNSSKKWGFIDKTGKVVIPCQWDEAYQFEDGLAAVIDSQGICFINKQGCVVFRGQSQWKNVSMFSDGLAFVKYSDGGGYIDKSGQIVIQGKWKNLHGFAGGFAAVWDYNDKRFIIDKTGKIIDIFNS